MFPVLDACRDGSSNGVVSTEASSTLDGGPSSAGTSDASAGGTLYQRLGGHLGVRSAVSNVLDAERRDPDIATYFVGQTSTSAATKGHPSLDQLAECFTVFAARSIGGTEVYPAQIQTEAGAAYECRDLATAHAHLRISQALFDRFVAIAMGVIRTLPGTTSEDVATFETLFHGVEAQVVDPNNAGSAAGPFDASASEGGSH